LVKKTQKLIEELSNVLYDVKFILLQGGIGVGKTFIAKEVSKNLGHPNFLDFPRKRKKPKPSEVHTEIVSIHQSYIYDDFIYGIITDLKTGKLKFEYKDKIFIELLSKAVRSWIEQDNKKYVLILDDINRGLITDILGEAITLMEPHGTQIYIITLKNGRAIEVPPNFYVIATLNNAIETPFKIDYALQRRFHTYTIQSDFEYVADLDSITDKDILNAHSLYRKVKSLVLDNLNYRYKGNVLEREKLIIGHGYFSGSDYFKKVKWQVLPLLRQYQKDGVLEKDISITNLEEELKINYTTNSKLINNNRIQGAKEGVTSGDFLAEESTHVPLINIIGRIKEQGILSDIDIENKLLFNDNVAYRKSQVTSYSANLYASTVERMHIRSNTNRQIYKSRDEWVSLNICNKPFYVTGEIQPGEFKKWEEKFLDENHVNELRGSSAPNTILFFIVKNYYQTFISNCIGYLQEYPSDTNIKLLKEFAEEEWAEFLDVYKPITSLPDEISSNKQVKYYISDLKLLWTNIDNTIFNKHGDTIVVKGVYKMDSDNKYKEYKETMDSLEINQMILQGPPGTSKTYSTRELLKFIGEDLDDDELNELQIKNYGSEQYCEYLEKNTGEIPKIAWDIVQFHPSYGYEDFIRGIEVTTNDESEVMYSTVNKVLGKMAELAQKAKEYNEKGEAPILTKFFLIVDEINRANLATVFGELIYSLEYRGEGVATPYAVGDSNKLILPNNLYIIGTMNTADKSIGGIDYAIRRRFLFFSLLPNRNVIISNNITDFDDDSEENKRQIELNNKACKLFDNVSRLFDDNLSPEYYKEDVQVGHTYFLVNDEEQLYRRFKYQIVPILREYAKDGMFQLDVAADDKDGWNGFLNCLAGNINLNQEETVINSIFKELIKIEQF
jgi:5-methylcytosine-specific restriction endonuclease McrBC GTP-binding regulatory subunit McrB